VQVREDAAAIREAVAALDDPSTARALLAERTLLALSGSGCSVPFGAWCREASDGCLVLTAFRCTDRGRLLRVESSGSDPVTLAEYIWQRLKDSEAA
jgi:hydroxymethylbilane synthase